MSNDRVTFFGFWIYLMTDFVLFAGLFAMYAVLHGNIAGGPTGSTIFNGPFVLLETLLLLCSSYTMGLCLLAAQAGKKSGVIFFLLLTMLLGILFVSMELFEFSGLVAAGHSWQQSGFLSAYFTLVGTHGLHVAVGLLWMAVLTVSILVHGFSRSNMRKLLLISLFWHFLDIIWIFIFSLVYLFGII